MKGSKYYLIFLFFLLIIAAFSVQGLIIEKTDQVPEPVKPAIPKEVDHSLEIKGTLDKYDRLISSQVKETGTIGAAVVITYKNQIVFLKCFGVRKKGDNIPVNENTIFRLASVSKTISGVLAGILDDEHIIRLDDHIIDFIPGFHLKDPLSTKELTIRNILSHTSGLIPHAYDNLVEEHVPFDKILTQLANVDIAASPGQIYGYQNVMFSIYDTVATVKTSENFGDLIKEKVFEPFHMTDACTGFEAFSQSQK